MELAAGQNADLRRQCYELRTGVEAMDYQVLRQRDSVQTINPARLAVPPQVVSDLKDVLRARGDQELLDVLVISEATGLRPGELARGVRLNQLDQRVCIHIQGGKRHDGVADADTRFRAERGADRVVEVSSPEVSELASRHHGYFRPTSSPDALRGRLRTARQAIPGGEDIRFYSFRHALKNQLEIEGHSREDIAHLMGHRSTRSQANYWTSL
jgi:integrase